MGRGGVVRMGWPANALLRNAEHMRCLSPSRKQKRKPRPRKERSGRARRMMILLILRRSIGCQQLHPDQPRRLPGKLGNVPHCGLSVAAEDGKAHHAVLMEVIAMRSRSGTTSARLSCFVGDELINIIP